MQIADLRQIDAYEWEIPRSYRQDMRVPVRIFASRAILDEIVGDRSLEQAVNSATLPGLVGAVYVMPDMHQGYGFPIGGVAATRYPDGVVSPGAIGYDINCGVRLLTSSIPAERLEPHLDTLADALDYQCPSGVGVKGRHRLSATDLRRVAVEGARWALDEGLATPHDLAHTEEEGCMKGASTDFISDRAVERGMSQLGTLGAGNHFLEVQVVDRILDEAAAARMGLRQGHVTVLVHSGSRGFGHQICTDYVKRFQRALATYDIELPDRQLVCAPLDSDDGQQYLASMRAAANFAFTNRQLLAHGARRAFDSVLGKYIDDVELTQVYDITHNMGKLETHCVDGEEICVCVHRKGATRAFGPGRPEVPEDYRDIGQPVFVPGSMGTASWVLVGTEGSMERSFGSSCHGAGRTKSRSQAKREVDGQQLRRELAARGIRVRAGSMSGLAEEAPKAYKDVDEVIEAVDRAGIARQVARLRPIAVVKG